MLESLVDQILGQLIQKQVIKKSPLSTVMGVRPHAPGSPITFYVFLKNKKQPDFFLKVSRFPGLPFLREEKEKHDKIAFLPGAWKDRIAQPLFYGEQTGHSFLLYSALQHQPLYGFFFRVFLKDKLYSKLTEWLIDVAQNSESSLQMVERNKKTFDGIQRCQGMGLLPQFEEMFRKAKDFFGAQLWQKGIFQHRDLFRENILFLKLVPMDYRICDLASSSFEGFPFADLFNLSLSFGVQGVKLLKTVRRYANAVGFSRDAWLPFAVGSAVESFWKHVSISRENGNLFSEVPKRTLSQRLQFLCDLAKLEST